MTAMTGLRFSIALLALAAGPAMAQDQASRDYCPDRPGIGEPPCTMAPGRTSFEMSPLDWTREQDADSVSDTLLAGDLSLRYGVAEHAEFRIAWTPYGHVRVRDRASGEIGRTSGVGDVVIGLRRNLVDPTGQGFSIALQPSVSLPTGGAAIGAGDWGASLMAPVSIPLGQGISLGMAPEVDAAVDGDRHGRHLAYALDAGVSIKATDKLTLILDGLVERDEDPDGATTHYLAGASLALMANDDLQLDIASEVGLNGDAPDARLYFGFSRRF